MNAKDRYIKALVDSKALLVKSIEEEPFTLRSGKKSRIFLNQSLLALKPAFYIAYIDAMKDLLVEHYGTREFIICNVDSKLSPQITGALAYIMKKPLFIYRPDTMVAAEKGATSQLTGDSSSNLPVAVVDDVISTIDGTSKRIADRVLNEFPKISDIQIFVGLVRTTGKPTYKTHYILTYDELIEKIWDTLRKGQQEAIENERKEGI